MHIKPGEQAQSGTGRQGESSTGRKLRLGGPASRVPVQTKASDSPLQALVSAIGQSFGNRTQSRNHTVGSKEQAAVRTSLFTPGSKANHGSSSTTLAEGRTTSSSSLSGRLRSKEPATATRSSVVNSLRTPTTPASSRVPSTPSTTRIPSSPSPSSILSNPSTSRIPSTPSASRIHSTSSTSRIPSTPSVSRIPSTPSVSRIPSTPSASRVPSTPSASRVSSTPSASRVPSTPSASRVPLTPASSRVPSTPSSTRIPSTPGVSSRTYYTPASSKVPSTAASKLPSTPTAASRLPNTPGLSKVQAAAERSSRRNSLSSSSSSFSSSGLSTSGKIRKPSQAASGQYGNTVSNSALARKGNPTTPVSKNLSMPPRTPKAQNDPITPASKISSILTPRRQAATSTPVSKQQTTFRTEDMSALPITPMCQQIAVTPGTPIHGVQNDVSTPYSDRSAKVAFYTPSSTLPLTPLQPKNFNAIESSRKLQFGADGIAAGDQENLGCLTPKPYDAVATEATFTFDKNRLAQIRARRSSSQLLKSPAQRVIRVLDAQRPAYTPGRGLQQVDEDRSARFDDDDDDGGGFLQVLASTPGRRRVANALF